MIFYETFKTQFEVIPRVTIIYGKNQVESSIEKNGLAIEWLWFGVFIQIGKSISK